MEFSYSCKINEWISVNNQLQPRIRYSEACPEKAVIWCEWGKCKRSFCKKHFDLYFTEMESKIKEYEQNSGPPRYLPVFRTLTESEVKMRMALK